MDNGNILESDGFFFIHNFDSGNLGHVERVPKELIQASVNHKTNSLETPEYEFNLWTRPDCAGTEFENGNRTWFYFGIQGGEPGVLVRLNVINLNKQGKMYNQGMAPVTRTLPGKPQWERIRDRPIHSTDDNTFMITFKFRTAENMKATTFFAFTYPFSFAELQIALNSIDLKFLPLPPHQSLDDIYYCRENLIYTLEGRRTDLLTISSHHGITSEREERLKNLFPDRTDRPFKFLNKKIIFVSARVHPGETPSSFVFNGFLNLILTRHDPIAIQLRRLYVFKMVPFLNPDGVARGHYRTDTRGVNLNRVYLNPSLEHHPTVYAARSLIRYHHFGFEKDEDSEDIKSISPGISRSIHSINEEQVEPKKKKPPPVIKRCISPTAKAPTVTLKSSSHIKTPSIPPEVKKVAAITNTGEMLTGQVCEMKLQEVKSRSSSPTNKTTSLYVDKTSSTSTFVVDNSPSLLDDVVIRDCLGSEVHLSRSDELNINGPNPLRQLRDTLKNSISLLIGANSYPIIPSESNSRRDSRSEELSMKIGWCRECRAAAGNLDEHLSDLAELTSNQDSIANTSKYESAESSEQYMFCSNCLRKYPMTEIEQEIKVTESTSEVSETISAGDNADMKHSREHSSEEAVADSNGDSVECKPKVAPKPKKKQNVKAHSVGKSHLKEPASGLYLYIDLHGHASKKGIFMYGNHFEELESSVECMLLPRIMSLNNLHFHFSSCNFTERNMYLRDRRDGMSREGSGRVAVLKATGLVRSYTLECNYNTGRLVNVLPPTLRETPPTHGPSTSTTSGVSSVSVTPPKYTPHIFEEVGRSLGSSILDLTGQHPNSRIPGSEHRNLSAMREWLRAHTRNSRPPQLTVSRLRPKTASPSRVPLYARSLTKNKLADVERKENTYIGAKPEGETKKPTTVRSGRSNEIIVNRFATKKTENSKVFGSRSRHCSESETKPKALSVKRRNVLAIRKPNAGKARSIKSKTSHTRRTVDEVDTARSTISSKVVKNAAGTFAVRSFRRDGPTTRAESERPKVVASSSSSEEVCGWEDVTGGTILSSHSDTAPLAGKRRPYPPPPPTLPVPHLKKIRLKTTS